MNEESLRCPSTNCSMQLINKSKYTGHKTPFDVWYALTEAIRDPYIYLSCIYNYALLMFVK